MRQWDVNSLKASEPKTSKLTNQQTKFPQYNVWMKKNSESHFLSYQNLWSKTTKGPDHARPTQQTLTKNDLSLEDFYFLFLVWYGKSQSRHIYVRGATNQPTN